MRTASWFRFLTHSPRKNRTCSARAGRKQRPALFLDTLEDRTLPSAYVVTTTIDSGPGSLRDAITKLNQQPGRSKLSARVGIDSGAVVVGAGATRTPTYSATRPISPRACRQQPLPVR